MQATLIRGDARRLPLADRSVHCVVTSPPYWGLRDYGVDGQIGLERTPTEFVAAMVRVFREVWRVLRDNGTAWVNLGDSYVTNPGNGRGGEGSGLSKGGKAPHRGGADKVATADGLMPKNLCGIPWRVALALQADGWYLRADIIWAKPNPMPESVTDRPTKSHEYLFLLSKGERYFYDADAVREPDKGLGHRYNVLGGHPSQEPTGGLKKLHMGLRQTDDPNGLGRNLRTVWSIPSEAYPGAHFATYPRRLVEPCIKAGTSERGCCPMCGAGWERVVERTFVGSYHDHSLDGVAYGLRQKGKGPAQTWTPPKHLGWRPGCACDAGDPVPAVVLDPFAGSGTTLVVATALGRRAIGCDLSPEYLALARRRIERPHAPTMRPVRDEVLPLFA